MARVLAEEECGSGAGRGRTAGLWMETCLQVEDGMLCMRFDSSLQHFIKHLINYMIDRLLKLTMVMEGLTKLCWTTLQGIYKRRELWR